jgi:hypothetical protein
MNNRKENNPNLQNTNSLSDPKNPYLNGSFTNYVQQSKPNSNSNQNNPYNPNYNPYNQPNYNPYNQPNYNPYNQPNYNPYNQPNYNPYNQPNYNPYNQPQNFNPYNQPNYNPYPPQPNNNPYNIYQQQNPQIAETLAEVIINQFADSIFEKFDFNKSGFLDVKEIYPAVEEIYKLSKKTCPSYHEVLTIMKYFDDDGNGLIDKAEFRNILKNIGGMIN